MRTAWPHTPVHRSIANTSAPASTKTQTNANLMVPLVGTLGVGLGAYTAYSTLKTDDNLGNPSKDACASDDDDRRARRLRRWAEALSAEFPAADVRGTKGAGVGVFYVDGSEGKRGWFRKNRVLMTSPDAAVVSARTAAMDPKLGEKYADLMRDGTLPDERIAAMVFLMVERRKGEASAWGGYIDALPRSYDAPLSLSDVELERELKGTNVYDAAVAQRAKVREMFDENVRPAMRGLSEVAAASGDAKLATSLNNATIDEFKWAFQTFWTRALAIPVNDTGEVVEGIVPGIDMVNHSRTKANARWEHVEDNTRPDGGVIALVSNGKKLGHGDEIFIDYGESSSEALFFTHGFVPEDDDTVSDGKGEHLVLYAPWSNEPASERSEDVARRIEALRLRNLPTNRVVLPARPPKRGIRDLEVEAKETLKVWVADAFALDNATSSSSSAAAAVDDRSRVRIGDVLRAALGSKSASLRDTERTEEPQTDATNRSIAIRRYRSSVRSTYDAWLDALADRRKW